MPNYAADKGKFENSMLGQKFLKAVENDFAT